MPVSTPCCLPAEARCSGMLGANVGRCEECGGGGGGGDVMVVLFRMMMIIITIIIIIMI